MTELEKIRRAKLYIDKLANGINPMIISSFTNVGYLMGDLTNYDEDFGL